MDRPETIDGFLEGRSVLNNLRTDTFIQWLAYGAIYPLDAKDFLLVTSAEPIYQSDVTRMNHSNLSDDNSSYNDDIYNKGFLLVSTSIDEICEINLQKSNDIQPTSIQEYTRSCLKLAGYIGILNPDGTTTLTFIIDLPFQTGIFFNITIQLFAMINLHIYDYHLFII